MASAASDRLRSRPGFRLLGIGKRSVVLVSPLPPDECARRLENATTAPGVASWNLDPRNAGSAAPRLQGDVGRSWALVAEFADTPEPNRNAAWLEISLQPSATGGTTLTGTIGLHPSVQGPRTLLTAIGGLFTLTGLAVVVSTLVSGRLSGLLPALIPLAMLPVIAGINASSRRSLQRAAPRLIDAVKEILDSTA